MALVTRVSGVLAAFPMGADPVTLYYYGDQKTPITGGWSASGYKGGSNAALTEISSYAADGMIFAASSSVYVGTGIVNSVNISAYHTKLIIKGTVTTSISSGYIFNSVLPTKSTNIGDAPAVYNIVNQTVATGAFQWDIDVSSLSGNYYFSCCFYSGNTIGAFKIQEVRLE